MNKIHFKTKKIIRVKERQYIIIPALFIEQIVFCHGITLAPLYNINQLKMQSFIFGFAVLLHWFVYLSLS